MAAETLSDEKLVAVLQDYLSLVQRHASAEEILERAVTPDFETGYAGGRRWSGAEGLREYLEGREGFFDERHVIEGLIKRTDLENGDAERAFVATGQ